MSRPIEELVGLEPGLLYVFVIGPGKGEAIALALPEGGWILVDSCTTTVNESSLVQLFRAFRRGDHDSVAYLMWTHPHEDHCEGLPDVVELLDPERVVLVGPDQAERPLKVEAARWREMFPPTELERQLQASVRNALQAITTWKGTHPEGLLAVSDPFSLEFAGRVKVDVRGPRRRYVEQFYANPDCYKHLAGQANKLSLVLELAYGETRIVLGGDLLKYRVEGWQGVTERHPHLGSHLGLKVPHHGSIHSFHKRLMVSGSGGPRTWWITPFNRSSLPRTEGLAALLQQEPRVHLTALAASKTVQPGHPHPAKVYLADVVERTNAAKSGSWLVDSSTDLRAEQAHAPLDPVWCCAFDSARGMRGRWRGRAALEVLAEAKV